MKNMKYLLRILGAVTLTGLSVTTLAACSGPTVTPFDISGMKAGSIPATTKYIIAATVATTTPTEIISGIMPSILEGVKKVAKNKDVTKDDFTVKVAGDASGTSLGNKDLTSTGVKIYVQITASSTAKVLEKDKKTAWLEYTLPQGSVATALSGLLVLTPVSDLYVGDVAAVKEKEIIDGITPGILTAIRTLTPRNPTIDEQDFKVKISSTVDGNTPVVTIDLGQSASTIARTIYVKVFSNGNSDVTGETATFISYVLPVAKLTKALVIPTKELTKILSASATPSIENVLLAINEVNKGAGFTPLTSADVTIVINADNASAKVTGKGQYHDSVDVKFTTILVKTELGSIIPAAGAKKLLVSADVLIAINEVNKGAGFTPLKSADVTISPITTESATVTGKGGYQGVISVTYVAKVEITDIAVIDPGNITVVSSKTFSDLNTDIRITNLIVDAINAANAINVNASDFTTSNNKPAGTQAAGDVTFTVHASGTSKKITGTFNFIIALKQ